MIAADASGNIDMSFVSSEAIQKARRIALRGRSAVACVPCKEAKTKCNDYRPCGRCKIIKQENFCRDEVSRLLFCFEEENLALMTSLKEI